MLATRFASLILLCGFAWSSTGYSQFGIDPRELSPGDTAANEVRAENCVVKFIRQSNIPAEVEGKLIELKMEEGDDVQAGQVIAVIDNTQAKLAVELKEAEEKEALLNATNEVNLKDARNSESLAKAEAESFKELHQQNAIPYYEYLKKKLEAVRATLRIELAEMQMQIAKVQYKAKESEREMAEFQLAKHEIKAEYGGYIEKRNAQLGEWVQAGSPIAMMTMLDRLRVEGVVDALRYRDRIYKGAPVDVLVYNGASDGRPVKLSGNVGFVSSEIDMRDRVRIWVDVDNQRSGETWLIKPGMKAEIVVR